MKNIAIYYRVSTDLQDFESQKFAVEKWLAEQTYEKVEVFTDIGSGAKNNRVQFQAMLADAKAGLFDTVVAFKLDRLTRSAFTAITTIIDLWQCGVTFISVTQPILSMNNDNPFRHTILAIFADIAQLEREQISVRTKAGIQAALKTRESWFKGVPRKISNTHIANAARSRAEGKPWKHILKYMPCTERHALRLITEYNKQQKESEEENVTETN